MALLILLGVVVVVAVVAGALALISTMQTFPVTVVADGQALELQTRPNTVAELLTAANIALDDGDRVSPPPDAALDQGMVVRVERARSVFLMVDGETTPLWTPLTNPAEILASVSVRVASGDRVLVDGTNSRIDELADWPVPASTIVVRHAVTLRVHDEDGTRTLQTTGSTVGEALFEAGITLYLTDTTTPDLNATLTNNLNVTITRASPVEIAADGETVRTRSRGTTVAAALADAGVALVGMDYAIPAESSPLRPGMTIRIIRVREEIEATQQPLDFETVYQADATIELDTEQVTQPGQPGMQETRTRVRYENGIAVERVEGETVVVSAPVNRVISYGTNIVIRTIDTPDGPREYWRKLRMYVTSYHPAALDGDSTTATGHTVQRGIVGSDPNILPYGTQIYVPEYGVGEVQDTGGARSMPLWVDLGYSDSDYRGWYGYHDVYILTPVPPNIDYTLAGT
ncbi:MAG: ubiquitin-like domain-containing protein, partial [Chloroflexota bacterium]